MARSYDVLSRPDFSALFPYIPNEAWNRVNPILRNVVACCLCGIAGVALSGCRQAGDADITMLKPGAEVKGEITTASRVNYSDGSRSVLYAFDLAEGQAVRVEVRAGFCGRLTLLGAAGDGVQHKACERGSDVVSLTAKGARRHTVAFSGQDAGGYGPFTLVLRPIDLYRGAGTLAPGGIVEAMREEDTDGIYTLRVAEAGRYRIDLMSSEFDPELSLDGSGLELRNDDGGEGLDARIVAWLEPGEYRLKVRAADERKAGLYKLLVVADDRPLPPGERLRNGSPLVLDAAPAVGMLENRPARHPLTISAPTRLTLDLGSGDFDAKLKLTGPGVRLTDDDGGDGTNARIVTLLEPGTYAVEVTELRGSNAGVFTLEARGQPATEPRPLLGPGQARSAELVAGGKDRYRLSIPSAGRYVIRMQSDELDSYLSLLRGGSWLEDDDGEEEGGNARLETTLAPGEYELVAEGLGGSHGPYRISVESAGQARRHDAPPPHRAHEDEDAPP